MTSITTQQTKLDLELVPKENRLVIGKCNGRIPHGLKAKEETFQVVLNALAFTTSYPAFIITVDVPEVYMHQFWNSVYKHDTFYRFKIDKKKRFKLTLEVLRDVFQFYPRIQGRDFDALPSEEDTISFLRDLIHSMMLLSIRCINLRKPLLLLSTEVYLERLVKEASQIYGAVLPDCLTSLEMKESKAYNNYLSYATGVVPPKIARKFKKASPSKKDSVPIQADEEPIQKGKRVKRSAKKSSTTPAAGIIIKETPVKTKYTRKEKVDVSRGKGIDLLSEVALAEKAQLKEVRKKSLRDFHKTHPSGSGMVAKKPPSVEKITPTVTSEGTGNKPGVPDVAKDDSTESDSESWGNDEDDSNDEQESKDESSEQENESEEQESDDSEQEDESDDDDQEEEDDEEKGLDDTDYQFDDDVDARLKEPTQTDKEVVQGEGADAEMIDAQQGNENLETTQEQVVEDARVTISTVTKKTEVPATSSSRSSDLASKFLNFSDIPHTDAETVSPLDVHVHHEVPRTQAPTLLTIPISVITESSPVYTKNSLIITNLHTSTNTDNTHSIADN
ncbi:hypothetical protein Tco_1208457 [Tanacetum coccineum]